MRSLPNLRKKQYSKDPKCNANFIADKKFGIGKAKIQKFA